MAIVFLSSSSFTWTGNKLLHMLDEPLAVQAWVITTLSLRCIPSPIILIFSVQAPALAFSCLHFSFHFFLLCPFYLNIAFMQLDSFCVFCCCCRCGFTRGSPCRCVMMLFDNPFVTIPDIHLLHQIALVVRADSQITDCVFTLHCKFLLPPSGHPRKCFKVIIVNYIKLFQLKKVMEKFSIGIDGPIRHLKSFCAQPFLGLCHLLFMIILAYPHLTVSLFHLLLSIMIGAHGEGGGGVQL